MLVSTGNENFSNIPADVLWEATPSSNKKVPGKLSIQTPCLALAKTTRDPLSSRCEFWRKHTHTCTLRCSLIHKTAGADSLGLSTCRDYPLILALYIPRATMVPVPSTTWFSHFMNSLIVFWYFLFFWLQLAKVNFFSYQRILCDRKPTASKHYSNQVVPWSYDDPRMLHKTKPSVRFTMWTSQERKGVQEQLLC